MEKRHPTNIKRALCTPISATLLGYILFVSKRPNEQAASTRRHFGQKTHTQHTYAHS